VLVWGSEEARTRAQTDGFAVAESKADLLTRSDILTLHLRLSDTTQGCLRSADLALMKPTSLLVNTSRAELIEPDALVAGLNRGRPGMAAVDVFESEPILQGHALLRLENCICTPHIGFVEQDSYELYFSAAFDNVVNFLQNQPTHIVNPEALKVRR
jgi:D-3-phosphoglycerate dehydrogenase / 2-oxoglutarate reductase